MKTERGMSEQCALEIEWDRSTPDSRKLPRLVGPFQSREEADEWASLNIVNGTWNVAPLAWPYAKTGDDL